MPPYVEALRSAGDKFDEIAIQLKGIGADLATELPVLVDMLDDFAEPGQKKTLVGLMTYIARSSDAYAPLLSRLPSLVESGDEGLRFVAIIALWNSGQTSAALRSMEEFVVVFESPPSAAERPDFQQYLNTLRASLRQSLWSLRQGDDALAFWSFYRVLTGIGVLDLEVRLQGHLQTCLQLFHAILAQIEEDGTGHELLEMAAFDDPESIPRLIGLLQSNEPGVRANVAAALCKITSRPSDVEKQLVKLLDDKDAGVRAVAVTALPRFKEHGEELERLLVRATSDRNEVVRCPALRGLGDLGINSPQVASAVLKCLVSPKCASVLTAASEVAAQLKIRGDDVPPAIHRFLADRSQGKVMLRAAAARACATLGFNDPDTMKALDVALRVDTNHRVCREVGMSLYQLDGSQTNLSYVTSCLASDLAEIAERALTIIKQMGLAAVHAKKDMEGIVETAESNWMAAARLLWKIGCGEGEHDTFRTEYVARLVRKLRKGFPGAAVLLAELGKEAAEAMPALREACTSKYILMRYRATLAVQQIGLE